MIKHPLTKIADKLCDSERLDRNDGVTLFTDSNLLGVAQLANSVRESMHSNKTYFNYNIHLNVTNVCECGCEFCSFSRSGEALPGAYTMSIEQAIQWIDERHYPELSEIHMVNGLNPNF